MWSRLTRRGRSTEDLSANSSQDNAPNPNGPPPTSGPPLSGPPMAGPPLGGPPSMPTGTPPMSGPPSNGPPSNGGVYGSALGSRYPTRSKRAAAPANAGGPGAFYNPDAFFSNQPKPEKNSAGPPETHEEPPTTEEQAPQAESIHPGGAKQLGEDTTFADDASKSSPVAESVASAQSPEDQVDRQDGTPPKPQEDELGDEPESGEQLFQHEGYDQEPQDQIHQQGEMTQQEFQGGYDEQSGQQFYDQGEGAYEQYDGTYDEQSGQLFYQQGEASNEQYQEGYEEQPGQHFYQQEGYEQQPGQYYEQNEGAHEQYEGTFEHDPGQQYYQQGADGQYDGTYEQEPGQQYYQQGAEGQFEGTYEEQAGQQYYQEGGEGQYEGAYEQEPGQQYYQQGVEGQYEDTYGEQPAQQFDAHDADMQPEGNYQEQNGEQLYDEGVYDEHAGQQINHQGEHYAEQYHEQDEGSLGQNEAKYENEYTPQSSGGYIQQDFVSHEGGPEDEVEMPAKNSHIKFENNAQITPDSDTLAKPSLEPTLSQQFGDVPSPQMIPESDMPVKPTLEATLSQQFGDIPDSQGLAERDTLAKPTLEPTLSQQFGNAPNSQMTSENDPLAKPSLAPTLSQQFNDVPNPYEDGAMFNEVPSYSQQYSEPTAPDERLAEHAISNEAESAGVLYRETPPQENAFEAAAPETSSATPTSQQYATSIGFEQTPAHSEYPSSLAVDTLQTEPPSSSTASQHHAGSEAFSHGNASTSPHPSSSTPKEEYAGTVFDAIPQKPPTASPSPKDFASSAFAHTASAANAFPTTQQNGLQQYSNTGENAGTVDSAFGSSNHQDTPHNEVLHIQQAMQSPAPAEPHYSTYNEQSLFEQEESQAFATMSNSESMTQESATFHHSQAYPFESSSKETEQAVLYPDTSKSSTYPFEESSAEKTNQAPAPPPMIAPRDEPSTASPEMQREAQASTPASVPTRAQYAYPFDKPFAVPSKAVLAPPPITTFSGEPEYAQSSSQDSKPAIHVTQKFEEPPTGRPEPLTSLPDTALSVIGSDTQSKRTPLNGHAPKSPELAVSCDCDVVDYGSRQGAMHKRCEIATGICFLDHMIDQLQSHGLFIIHCVVSIDGIPCMPHTDYAAGSLVKRPRDSAIFSATGEALGAALSRILMVSSDAEAVFSAPLDEALVEVQLCGGTRDSQFDSDDEDFDCDLAPYGDVPRGGRLWIGRYRTSLTPHFWKGVMRGWGLSRLVLSKRRGRNAHHIIEATFKAFARAARSGVDASSGYTVSSIANGGSSSRAASRSRSTKETSIGVTVKLDVHPAAQISTGIAPYDQLLRQLVDGWSSLDLSVDCKGDTYIDDHHTIEDVAIVLGQSFDEALGDRRGCNRMANATVRNVQVIVDLSGRPHLEWRLEFQDEWLDAEHKTMSTEMLEHIFQSLAIHAKLTLHVHRADNEIANSLHGRRSRNQKARRPSSLEIATDAFAALGQALGLATTVDPRRRGTVASSKGSLDR